MFNIQLLNSYIRKDIKVKKALNVQTFPCDLGRLGSAGNHFPFIRKQTNE
jgi:hypothetical protein